MRALDMGGYLDRIAASHGSVLVLVGRLALVAIFVPSGFGKLTHLDAFAQTLATRGVPAPGLMAVIGRRFRSNTGPSTWATPTM
jgi:uncharacterized membrane protein YphA (DoxX/SURF4 family)